MKIYICILSITLCVLQVSDGKPPHGHKHGHGSPGENDIYAEVRKPPKHGSHGHGHSHHCPCGPPEDPSNVIYAQLDFGGPCQDPIYENVGHGSRTHRGPDANDPETLYSSVAGPGRGGRGGHHGGGHHGRYGGENEIGGNDDDNEPTHDYLPFQCSGGRRHGQPPLPPRPPNGHPDPQRHHHQNQLYRRNACRK